MDPSSNQVDAVNVIKRTWQVFTDRLPLFVGLTLISFLSILLFVIPVVLGLLTGSWVVAAVLFVVALVAVVYINVRASAAIVRQSIKLAQNQESAPSISAAFRDAKAYAGGYLLTSIAFGLLLAVGFILLIIPGIIFTLWYVVAIPARLDDQNSVSGAFAKSKSLTKGHYGTIIALIILIFLVNFVMSLLTGGADTGTAADSTLYSGLSGIALIASFIVGILVSVGSGVLYAMLKNASSTDVSSGQGQTMSVTEQEA